MEDILGAKGHILKCESDDQDLSGLHEDTITKLLSDRIFDSSITFVLISPGMKEYGKKEREQWIPWEISYSLTDGTRKSENGTRTHSKGNGVVAIALPDMFGSYAYIMEEHRCGDCSCRTLHTDRVFSIISENWFNANHPDTRTCENGRTLYYGSSSYIPVVKWDDFTADPDKYVKMALDLKSNIDNYHVTKRLAC